MKVLKHSLPLQLSRVSPFPSLFLHVPIPDIHPFFSPFHLSPCLWPRLGGICQQKMVSKHQLSGSLFPCLSSFLSWSLSFPALGSLLRGSRKCCVLHICISETFIEQSGTLNGHWENISAGGICCAPKVPHPLCLHALSLTMLADKSRPSWQQQHYFLHPQKNINNQKRDMSCIIMCFSPDGTAVKVGILVITDDYSQ